MTCLQDVSLGVRSNGVRIIESNIAGDVTAFEYAQNHHYLKLKDSDGNETVMVEHGLVKYTCARCDFEFFTLTSQANRCCLCGGMDITAEWTRPQVSLVPEKQSDFKFVQKADADEEEPEQ